MNNILKCVWAALKNLSWSPPVLLLFFTCGALLTVKTRFIQLRAPMQLLKRSKKASEKYREEKCSGLSRFEALSAALAGTVGTGNIAGVTLAIMSGGAGAVFWLWVSAFLGMAVKYSEIRLSLRYRVCGPEGKAGGPMYYIENGLGKSWRPLAICFAFFGALCSFGIGNLAQCREIAAAGGELLHISPAFIGFILSCTTAYMLIGGVKRLGRVSSILVPVMSIVYLAAAMSAIVLRFDAVPAAIKLIFTQALRPQAALGGISSYAYINTVRHGFARGIFSNEAGLGSSPMAHAACETENEEYQARLGVPEVFISSVIFCSATAFVLLLSDYTDNAAAAELSGVNITANAFDAILPFGLGGFIIRLSLIFFAFSSLMSWSYYGRCCVDYLSSNNKTAVCIFMFLFALCCTFGAIAPGKFVWELSDMLNIFMAVPNIAALIILSFRENI